MLHAPTPPGPLQSLWPGLSQERLVSLVGGRPARLPVPTADERRVWAGTTGCAPGAMEPGYVVADGPGCGPAVDAVALDGIAVRAERDRGQPWPVLPASGFARYFRDGNREDYEQVVFARQRRFTRAAVMAARTLEPVWLDETIDGAIALCEQSTWCWPAHDDTHARHGRTLPTVTDPYVDLGSGEVVGQLAWLDHLLGTELEARAPGLRARLRHEADKRVLTPFLRRMDWHWLGLHGDVHNWTPWIHGNILVAALVLESDPVRRAMVVGRVIEGLDRYLAVLPPDGAIDEGYSYWWNGACRALEALDLLEHATDGSLDAVSRVPALRETIAFPHRMHLGGDWYVNVADAPARLPADQPWHALYRAALRTGQRDAAAHAAVHRRTESNSVLEEQGLGRALRALTDEAWLTAGEAAAPLPRQVWLPSVHLLLARTDADSAAGLTLVAKGGHNGEHHNHNDVGEVIVALNGVPVLVDPGRPTYTAQTFGAQRYDLWTMQSSWHSVPEIRGTAQAPGEEYGDRDVRVQLGDFLASLSLDIAPAYPRGDIEQWRRTAGLDRLRRKVTITDHWRLRPDAHGAVSEERLVVAGEVVRRDDHSVLVRTVDGTGTVLVESTAPVADVDSRRLEDPLLSRVWGERLLRIRVAVPSEQSGALTLTIRALDDQEVVS